MAFTTGNDINILQASDNAAVGAGAGNDKYILSAANVAANQQITLSDTAGTNTLQLMGGLTIASSQVGADSVQLTLSNGAVVTVLGASTFSYEIAGDPLSGTAGTVQAYSAFVTTTLGAASVPTTGTVSGTANVTIAGGSTGTTAGQSFSLTTGTDLPSLTAGNDTVTGAAGTLGADDIIVDASSTDSDVVNLAIDADLSAQQNVISKVETINLTFGFAGQFDAEKVSGATKIGVSGSTGVTAIAGLEGVSGGANVDVASGITTLTLDGRAVATDTATLTINNNLTVINSAQPIETLTIKNAATTAKTVTFDGTGDLTVGATQVINLQGAGDLTVRVDAADVSGQTVNASMDSGKKAVLSLDTTSDDTDVSKVATAVTINLLDDDIEDELLQVANNAVVRLSDDFGNGTGDATQAIAAKTGTTNTLNLESNFATQTLLNLDGFTTVNLSALVDTVITNLEALTTTDVVVSGEKNVTIQAGTTKSVSATGLTGVLDVTLDTTLNKITGGSGNDILTLADDDFNFTVVGGDGTDTLENGGAFDLTAETVSISGVEVIDLLNADLTIAAEVLEGQTIVVKSTGGGGNSLVADLTNVLSADYSNMTLDTTTADVTWAISSTGMGHTIKGSKGADIMNFSTSTAKNTLTGNAGDDQITGGSNDDTITAGEGADVIVTTAGTDTISLTENVAAADTVTIGTTVAGTAKAVITGFDFGGTATDDDLIFDLSSLEAMVSGDLVDGAGTSIVANGAITVKKVTAKTTDIGAAADELITIDGNYASAAELQTALESGGSMELVFGAFDTAADTVLIAYDNGADTYIAALTTSGIIADGAKAGAGTLTATTIVTLTGVADATSLVAADFGAFIA